MSAIFTLLGLLLAGGLGGWETYAIKNDKTTITKFTQTHPHAMILLGLLFAVIFGLFGYTLGQGGQ